MPYRCFKAIQALYQTSLEDCMRRYTFVHDYYIMSPLATFMILSQKAGFQMVFSIWHSSTTLTSSMANKLGVLVVVLVRSLMTILITEPLPLSFQKLLSLLSAAAAAAKSLQSCPTLCDPVDSSPPGSPVPGILQARRLEWVAISFSSA